MSDPRAIKVKKEGTDQDFELNIVSIIDCFTVLIIYVLAAASFISIGIMDVGIFTQADGATENLPPVSVAIRLQPGKMTEIRISGGEKGAIAVPSVGGARDLASLSRHLSEIRSRWPNVDNVTVSADDDVVYSEMVKVIESAREVIPSVYIGEQAI